MKEAKDPLYEQMLNKDYKFPSVEQLSQVTSRTQLLCKKYFNQYWNMGGRDNAFLKAKKKMEKQLEKEIAADEKVQREQNKHEEENARDDDVGDHPF